MLLKFLEGALDAPFLNRLLAAQEDDDDDDDEISIIFGFNGAPALFVARSLINIMSSLLCFYALLLTISNIISLNGNLLQLVRAYFETLVLRSIIAIVLNKS